MLQTIFKERVDLSPFNPKDKPNAFFGASTKFGDLNNDGVYRDFIRYNNTNIQAFAYDGNGKVHLLWEYYSAVEGSQQPNNYFYQFILWDIDNDGRTEVIGAFPTKSGSIELRVLDGETGAVKSKFFTNIPNPTRSDRVKETQIYITVANTRGLVQPQDIVLLVEINSQENLFVFNENLALLWDKTVNTPTQEKIHAHYTCNHNIEGDSKDEFRLQLRLERQLTESQHLQERSHYLPNFRQLIYKNVR
ncbi:MAG: VCBS repeat-containing protein [Prochloraceae cyanobacterium]|nr:VCBS repeat-containing protein [Prochloraceae cyanobacterium]